jgi:hypothetical protein
MLKTYGSISLRLHKNSPVVDRCGIMSEMNWSLYFD